MKKWPYFNLYLEKYYTGVYKSIYQNEALKMPYIIILKNTRMGALVKIYRLKSGFFPNLTVFMRTSDNYPSNNFKQKGKNEAPLYALVDYTLYTTVE